MARITKVRLESGEERDALELDFEIQAEQWNEYKLLDGGRVRLKTSAIKILRVLDTEGNPAYTPDGDPLVWVRHNTYIASSE